MAPEIVQIAWSDTVDQALARALPNPVIRDIVAAEVRAGVSRLWHCRDDRHEAYVVTRVDLNPAQLVIVAFEGSGMRAFGPWFIERANQAGIPVRAHVTDLRVERLLRMGLQFKRSEVILLRDVEAAA